ncbi:MAG: hypothetical protein HY521_05330 [Proteobacteria bacterium]|nr:hypothetical protein [Pseudomonadota bacterium]
MTERRQARATPSALDALSRHFSRLAETSAGGPAAKVWKEAAAVDYRSANPFRYDMEWKDVSVLVNALKGNTDKPKG